MKPKSNNYRNRMQSLINEFKKENTQDKESISEEFTRHSQLNNEKEVEIVLGIVSETIRPTESESDELVIEKESKENDD